MITPVIIGANYGDEGKGLMVDHMVREINAQVVVRFNSGAQAGHTVVIPGGKRHVFGHFGAGTLAGAITFLSRFFVVNPILFLRERDQFMRMLSHPPQRIFIDGNCAVTTPYEMMINQSLERKRGADRHGSCGVGFGETIERDQSFPLRLHMLTSRARRHVFKETLESIRTEWMPNRLKALGLNDDLWPDVNDRFIEDCDAMLEHAEIVTDYAPRAKFVFEGAQGLALDMNSADFPHVTRSSTGLTNALLVAEQLGINELEPIYVTRPYLTRHGAGPLPNEVASIYGGIDEKTNVTNEFQGSFRYARLETVALKKRIYSDLQLADGRMNVYPRVAVTCLDQIKTYGELLTINGYRTIAPKSMPAVIAGELGFSHVYQSWGPTSNDVSLGLVS